MLGSTTPPSVLIVDDEIGPRESIRLVLEPRFRTMIAESGEQALDLLRHQRVDVVTLDLMMPGLGGIATFKKIREMDAELQILVVSGGLLDLARALPTPAPSAWMIPKPFDCRRLLEAVERAAEETRRCRLQAAESRAPAFLDTRAPRFEAAALTVNFLHTEESDGAALHLHKTPAALNQIVEEVMEDETPRARSRGIEFRADLDLRLPSVSLDVAMIAHALTNLLNSALHDSPEGGIVSVETRRSGDVMLLRVRHRGPGIPGVYLVRKIVEAHGGSVFTTTPPDGGSASVISLPCPSHENA